MPFYEYRCKKGHTFEVKQSMSDDPVTNCTTCSSSVQRVFHPVAVHFKGSGFYATDYGKKKRGHSDTGGDGGESQGSKDSTSKDSASNDSGSKGSGSGSKDKKSSGSKSE